LKTNNKQQAYKNYARDIHYLFLVGSLLFATQTWPNIQFAQFAIKLVVQFSENPGIAYLKAAKRILYYLKGIVNLNHILERCGKKAFDLIGWTNFN